MIPIYNNERCPIIKANSDVIFTHLPRAVVVLKTWHTIQSKGESGGADVERRTESKPTPDALCH